MNINFQGENKEKENRKVKAKRAGKKLERNHRGALKSRKINRNV